MIKAVQNAPLQYEVNANFLIKEMIWAGLSYRSGDAASAILGVQMNPYLENLSRPDILIWWMKWKFPRDQDENFTGVHPLPN